MKADTVLITGATGHLGFKVLVLALEAGYNARVAVRNESGIEKVLRAPSTQSLKSECNLSFVIVPDILSSGAYDEAVQGVRYIIHCASPITSGITEDFEEKLIRPAVQGTIGILKSAHNSSASQVQRVVITSSIIATIPPEAFVGQSDDTYDGQLKVPIHTGSSYPSEFHAYADSKVRALAATHNFIADKHPSFDIINIMPSFIIGKNELATLETFLTGTNRVVFGQVLGAEAASPLPGTTIYLNDVAKVHVLALDPKTAGNQDFPMTSGVGVGGVHLADARDIVARKFPAEVAGGILPNKGSQPSLTIKIDSSKTEDTLGLKFAGLETQVEEVARHYLELLAEEEDKKKEKTCVGDINGA